MGIDPKRGIFLTDSDHWINTLAGASNNIDSDQPETYAWQDGDKMFLQGPIGVSWGGLFGSPGIVVENPVGIITLLLQDSKVGMGLADDQLNLASFEAAKDALTGYCEHARCRITEDVKIQEVIAQICYEFGLRLIIKNGVYYIYHINWNALDTTSAVDIYEGQVNSWSEISDKNRQGIDGFTLKYAMKPSGEWTRELAFEAPADYQTSQAGIHEMASKWIYQPTEAKNRAQTFMLDHAGIIRNMDIDVDFSGLDLGLGDTVHMKQPEIDDYFGGFFLLTGLTHNFHIPSTSIELSAIGAAGPVAVYADDAGEAVPPEYGGGTVPADYANATAAQKTGLAFYADPADPKDEDKQYGC